MSAVTEWVTLVSSSKPWQVVRVREAPKRSVMWSGVKDATKDKSPCVQNNLFDHKKRNVTFGNEDCLYLNVFTPGISIHTRLPVMVYIHGGGFFSGSSTSELYGPEYILDNNVVLVVINYRLGPLGFLTTEDEYLRGNYGLKDQIEALRWIQRNIHYFGGNRNSVTLFGNDAGAASAHLHMMSPLSKGLFRGVISQSGSGLCQWSVNPPGYSKKIAQKVGKIFGCPTNSSIFLAECLRGIPAYNITSLIYKFLVFDLDPTVIFAPVIERHNVRPFLKKDPWKLTTKGHLIIGMVSEEGAMKVSSLTRGKAGDDRIYKFNFEYQYLLPTSLTLDKHAKNAAGVAEKVQRFYFNKQQISEENLESLINMYSDSWFTYCTAEAVKRHKGRVYQYYFSYKGNKSMSPFYGNDKDDLGVCHTDELIYLFPMHSYFPNRDDTKKDIAFSKTFMNLWINFATYSTPTPTRSTVEWMRATRGGGEFLEIGNNGYQMKKFCLNERFKFWTTLNFRERKGSFVI